MSQAPPVLFVSLVGFDPAAARRLCLLLDECTALGARWRVVRDGTCDLWIVDGAAARGRGCGLVEVAGGALAFRPAEMPHPVVFAEPVHESVATGQRFDAASMHSLNVLLTKIGRWLMPRLAQQALVAHLVASGASFTRTHAIEVGAQGRILALLDMSGDTAVAADATPAEIRHGDWSLRERDRSFVPPGFRITATQQVLWQFALRTEHADLLPARYVRLPIHLRRAPSLPAREWGDSQLRLLRELAYGPRTFAELGDRTGATPQALRRDLGALYLVGAITCDPGRSRAAREHRRGAGCAPASDPSIFRALPSNLAELTAPGLSRPAL